MAVVRKYSLSFGLITNDSVTGEKYRRSQLSMLSIYTRRTCLQHVSAETYCKQVYYIYNKTFLVVIDGIFLNNCN